VPATSARVGARDGLTLRIHRLLWLEQKEERGDIMANLAREGFVSPDWVHFRPIYGR
jgi:hypothetical protein